MKVNRLVIHQLEKDPQVRGIKLYNSSDELIPINDGINKMYSMIHESFEKDKTRHGKFELANTSNSVMINTDKYLQSELDDIYLQFTKASIDTLATRIKNETLATGGYYLFSDYEINSQRFLSIVIVRKKDSFNIEWLNSKKSFDLIDTKNVNVDKLAMGFRLNIGLYNSRATTDRNYIALLTNQGEDISKYFLEWVNVTDIIDARIHSKNLVDAIKNLGPLDPNEDAGEFQDKIFSYIADYKKINNGKVNIDKVSEFFYKDALRIRQYIEEKLEKEIDPEFKVDLSILRGLIQIKASVKGIKLTIDTSKLGNEVEIIDETLVIRNIEIIRQINLQKI